MRTRWEEPRGSFDKSGIGECFVQPAMGKAERPCGTSAGGVTSSAVPAGVVRGTARIAHNVKKKTERTIQSFVLQELFELMESLILAQDERWRRA